MNCQRPHRSSQPALQSVRRWSPVLAVLAVMLTACDRFEGYQIYVTGVSAQVLATQFAKVVPTSTCETSKRQPIEPGQLPPVPGEIFCRNWDTMVDHHVAFGLNEVRIDIHAVSGGLGPPPGEHARDRLIQVLSEVAPHESVVVVEGPSDWNPPAPLSPFRNPAPSPTPSPGRQ